MPDHQPEAQARILLCSRIGLMDLALACFRARSVMAPMPAVETARPEQREAAFRLIFGYLDERTRERRVANALHLLECGDLNPEALFIVPGSTGPSGAIICLPVPGASGLVWPPGALPGGETTAVEDALVRRASAWLQGYGARLGQALLTADELHLAGPLERNGYRRITTLWCLRHGLDHIPVERSPERLTTHPYDSNPDLFHATLIQTYEGTEDCPEVTGARTIEEIISGHMAQGVFDPARWRLAFFDGRPAGVLLLVETPDSGGWDLAYVGVIPAARRRGVGRELMTTALREAKAGGASQLTLSVDARNSPAAALYESLGFERVEAREVFLTLWSKPDNLCI
jgi:ribosomal protein S18 acetylase RimI-like enzyme